MLPRTELLALFLWLTKTFAIVFPIQKMISNMLKILIPVKRPRFPPETRYAKIITSENEFANSQI